MTMSQADSRRLSPNAGIAIGPILFIIAILAILAAAIAAGSGSFTAGTGTESNRTKSSALVEMGENLKIGMDNITMSSGIAPTSVIINPAQTGGDSTATSELFSPTGGGVAPPSTSMAQVVSGSTPDRWHYLTIPIPGLGTGAGDVVAVLSVAPASVAGTANNLCAEINNRTTGNAVAPAAVDLGNFYSDATPGIISGNGGVISSGSASGWPATNPNLNGVATGCVVNSDTSSPAAFFYQVLAIQ